MDSFVKTASGKESTPMSPKTNPRKASGQELTNSIREKNKDSPDRKSSKFSAGISVGKKINSKTSSLGKNLVVEEIKKSKKLNNHL